MYSARDKKKQLQIKSLRLGEPTARRGYTLLELLIVIVTMVLVSTVGMASYRSFQRRKVLDGSALKVQSDLRLAQEMSLSGKKPSACASYTAIDYIQLLRTSNSRYVIQVRCNHEATSVDIKSYDLNPQFQGVTFNPLFSNIIFNPLGRGIKMATEPTVITLFQSATGTRKYIKIYKSGEMNITDTP